MTVRSIALRLLVTLLVLVGIGLGVAYWLIGGGSSLVVTNVGAGPLNGVSVLLLEETGDVVVNEWDVGALRHGESIEIQLEPSKDANAAIRFTRPDGRLAIYRIRVYVGGHPMELRADVSNDGIERALAKRRRTGEFREADWSASPK